MNRILQGDATEVIKTLKSDSIDLICTDPPYGYSFMGKDWDKAVPSVEIWQECLRVLKPGAFCFVMSAPRSDVQMHMVQNLTEAGFRLDFTPIYWTYASGFPKAGNIGKMVDKRLGVKREKTGEKKVHAQKGVAIAEERTVIGAGAFGEARTEELTKATSPQAKALDGSYAGFQPKPAVEVIIVAMKPLSEKTFVDQALKNRKGITWLDDVRVPTSGEQPRGSGNGSRGESWNSFRGNGGNTTSIAGRFPANLLVENSILDYNICTCTPEVDTPTQPKDLNSAEDGIRATTNPENLTLLNEVPKSQPHSKASPNQQNTEPHLANQELPNTTSSDVSPLEAIRDAVLTTSGENKSSQEITSDVPNAGIEAQTVKGRAYTPTTSKPTQPTQNSYTKLVTDKHCAVHATGSRQTTAIKNSTNQYSRFFDLDKWYKTLPFIITPKASKSEKNKGLDDFPKVAKLPYNERPSGQLNAHLHGQDSKPRANHHPTVKPLKLMSYLITLGSREKDIVLDPFVGSGTTCIAAKQLGRKYIGIEREAEYVEIANARLKHTEKFKELKQESLL